MVPGAPRGVRGTDIEAETLYFSVSPVSHVAFAQPPDDKKSLSVDFYNIRSQRRM